MNPFRMSVQAAPRRGIIVVIRTTQELAYGGSVIIIRILSQRHERRTWLETVLAADPELQVVASGDDFDHILSGAKQSTDVIIVDLDHPQVVESRFWSALHIYFAGARLMALADLPIDPARLEAALHAGANYILNWREPLDRFWRAARAAGNRTGFIPLGDVLMSITVYFDASAVTAPNIGIGDAELDLRQSGFRRGTNIVPLTKLELELLVYLSSNAGHPVSTVELLRNVWHQSPESPRVREQIKATIKRLRRKLEPEPAQPRYLLNRHGHGYYVPGPSGK